ncbi:MAG: diguanylate phosphodiesterase, partial [Oscillibacter sp.]
MKKIPRQQSLLTRMFISMLLSLLVGTIFFGGMTGQLRDNAFDILGERVSGRRDNLAGEMVRRWSNLGESVDNINREAARILAENNADYADFTADSPLSGQLLNAVSNRLRYQLRRSSATGVFLILNGGEPLETPTGEGVQQRAGVYLRDYDPGTSPDDDSDLMLERAPMAFVQKQGVTLDTYWQPIFTFRAGENNDYYYKPYQAALDARGARAEDLGYWGAEDAMNPGDTPIITYSIPLLAEDGTPYGVFGVGVTLDYLSKQLPYNEINGDMHGSYVLAKQVDGTRQFEKILSTGPYFKSLFGSDCQSLTLSPEPVSGDSYEIAGAKNDRVYGCLKYLDLYNGNTPFENERWALIGILQDDYLLGLYYNVKTFLLLSLLLAFLIGLASVTVNTVRLTRPVMQLAKKVRGSDPNRPVVLGKINVAEIDELS